MIAMEVRRTINPKKRLRIKDFLLKFARKNETKIPETQAEKDAWIKRSKAAWTAAVGRKPQ